MSTRAWIQAVVLGSAALILGTIAVRATGKNVQAEKAFVLPPDQPVPTVLVDQAPAGFVIRELEVEGMCCNGCPRTLYERVRNLPEVESAAVSFDDSLVQAVVPLDFPVSKLEEALASDKYKVAPRP
ncbi:MAG: heavy metal-associated domain-containing protein [Planctomycetota bacterium]